MTRDATTGSRDGTERGKKQPAWAQGAAEPGAPDEATRAALEAQLMSDPPAINVAAAGGFAADRRQGRVRWILLLSGFVVLSTLVGGWLVLRSWAEWDRLHPYSLPPGTDTSTRPREIHWSSGKARLGLQRDAPAANVIVLPDRELRLADGCDHAQVYVDVRDGRTVELDVLIGDVVEQAVTAD